MRRGEDNNTSYLSRFRNGIILEAEKNSVHILSSGSLWFRLQQKLSPVLPKTSVVYCTVKRDAGHHGVGCYSCAADTAKANVSIQFSTEHSNTPVENNLKRQDQQISSLTEISQ